MTKHLLLAADRWNSSYTLSSFVKFISQPIEWSKIRLAVAEKTRDAAYHLNVKSRYVNECHNFRSPSANQVGSSISNISNLKLPENRTANFSFGDNISTEIQGGSAEVRPTYIFNGNI